MSSVSIPIQRGIRHRGPTCDVHPQDQALMRAVQRRDPHALAALVQRYGMLLKGVILRVIHDESAADDVMQECILEIWQQAHHYSPLKGRPLGWMVTVSKRRAIDHLRRRQAYRHAQDRLQADLELRPRAWNPEAIEETVEQSDLGLFLEHLMAKLPDPQEQVIRLAFFEGMSQREVAQATETPLGTVKTRMELGLKKLHCAVTSTDGYGALECAHRA